LHEGISPGSSLLVFPRYLYPSMPSDAYSKLSYDDVMAIKAYLLSLQPAAIPNRPTQIPFPLNTRAALLGWRILFFRAQPVQYDPSWSPSVRNGAFLVQALGHCSDCHTPRNILFGSETDKFLAGGHILAQSWYAPNISSQKQGGGVGAWTPADLANYLGGGGQVGVGAAYGPMQQVVNDSLSRLPPSDVQDIVAYLQTATQPQESTAPAAPAMTTQADGATVYANNCARCHGANGEGVSNNFPNLAANQSVWDGPPNNIISMVLGGFYPWHDDQSAMPGFRNSLSDDEIAAVSNYVRTAWGNQGSADATSGMVGDLRAYTTTEMDLDTASTKAALQTGDASVAFNDISGHLSFDGDQINCQITGHFGAANAAVNIGGACADGGSRFIGQATMNGQTMPVNFKISEERSGPDLNAIDLDGPVGGAKLHARISVVTPNG
jgi:mono/diheme cytochrome c family protein